MPAYQYAAGKNASLRPFLLCLPAAACLTLLVSGCSTPVLEAARHNFYAGRFDSAEKKLMQPNFPQRDRVLLLMERGTIRQAAGKYDQSARDYIEASDLIDQLETYSVSRGASSLVVNDNVERFRGAPYERTLLHVFTALDHLSLGNWENAAVEGRRIIMSLDPDTRGNYPDNAAARYIAGFTLEMMDDYANSALQYRLADKLALGLKINERTGFILPAPEELPTNITNSVTASVPDSTPPPVHGKCQLVCFALLGRSTPGTADAAMLPGNGRLPYVEIYAGENKLGRSYSLADTAWLAAVTEQKDALRKTAKTATRVAIKETIAQSLESNDNKGLADLTRFVLIGLLEQPDIRRWGTLPRWIQVARVSCPCDLKDYRVVVRRGDGVVLQRMHISTPITHRRNIFFSFFRYPPAPPPQKASSSTQPPK